MRVRLLLVAEQELDEAVAWYNNQADQLGSVFAAEVFDGIALMRDLPRGTLRDIIEQAGLTEEEFVGLH